MNRPSFAGLRIRLLHFWNPLFIFLAFVQAQGQTRLTIATVNNGDMIVMQKLSKEFQRDNPHIQVDWVVMEEKILREKTTTDAATHGGQFDVVTI